MTQATPATQPLINAEPAVAAQASKTAGGASDAGRAGRRCAGRGGTVLPRDVKLTFAQIAPPPGSMVLRGINSERQH